MECSKEIATQTVTDVGVSDEAVQSNEVPTVTTDNDRRFSGSRNESNNDVFLIEHETITRTWTPDRKGGFINLRSKDHALGKIGTLCHCRLVHIDPESESIIIRGDCEEDIEKAISKLRVVDKAAVSLNATYTDMAANFVVRDAVLPSYLQYSYHGR